MNMSTVGGPFEGDEVLEGLGFEHVEFIFVVAAEVEEVDIFVGEF